MPDTPVERGSPDPYDPGIEPRLSRVEEDMREVKGVLGQIVPLLTRIDATLSSTLPHLATKAELVATTMALSREIRADVSTQLAVLRSEVFGEIGVLKTDLTGVKADLNSVKTDVGSVKTDLGSVKTDLAAMKMELGGAILNLRAEMQAGLSDKPSKAYLWGVLGVLVAATVASYGAGLAAIALR